MVSIKNIVSTLLIGFVVSLFIVFYFVNQQINLPGFENEYEFLKDPAMRHLFSEDTSSQISSSDATSSEASSSEKNPNHLAHVIVDNGEQKDSQKQRNIPENSQKFKDNQIVFAVCCRDDYESIKRLIDDFRSLLYNTAIQPLQKATFSISLKLDNPNSASNTDQTKSTPETTKNTQQSSHVESYKEGDKLHTVHTETTKTTITTALKKDESPKQSESPNKNTKNKRLSTRFSTDDIAIDFDQHLLKASGSSPLLLIYTLKGDPVFLKTFIKELWLRQASHLENGIKTIIESTHEDVAKKLMVHWFRPIFEIPTVATDTNNINMLLDEINSIKKQKAIDLEKVKHNQILLQRELRKMKLLQTEKASIIQVLHAAQNTYPYLTNSDKLMVDSIAHLKDKSMFMQNKIEELQDEHHQIDLMIKTTKSQMDNHQKSYNLNQALVAELRTKLRLLHQQRLHMIQQFQELVNEFEVMAQVITFYQIFLTIKEHKESELDTMTKGRTEKIFNKIDDHTLKCSNSVTHLMCNERAILCRADHDIFEHDDTSITADIHFINPKTFKHNYEILVLANDECEHEIIDFDQEIKATTVHKCTMHDTNCKLQSKSPYSTFRKDKEFKDLCIFIRCDVADTFDVDANIAIKFNDKPTPQIKTVVTKQKQSVLKQKHSVSINQQFTKQQTSTSSDHQSQESDNSDNSDNSEASKETESDNSSGEAGSSKESSKEASNDDKESEQSESEQSESEQVEDEEEILSSTEEEDDEQSSSDNLQSMVAMIAAICGTAGALMMSIFFLVRY